MTTLENKKNLIKSLGIALKQYDKLIIQEINPDELDPEKAKAAAQGKSEATKGYRETLNIIDELTLEIEQEELALSGETKESTFTGLEKRINK